MTGDHLSAYSRTAPFAPLVMGTLTVKLAEKPGEVEAAQRLRYDIFCGEIGATPTPEMEKLGRDFDRFDMLCDHLLVLHTPESGQQEVVGTYRLLRDGPMREIGHYYTEDEFDISALKNFDGNIMELGRSCVRADFRNRAAMQLLWKGIGAYVMHHQIGLMFGCASFSGADPAKHREGLAYLHHFHHAEPDLCVRALPERYVPMDTMPADAIDRRAAFHALPVLVKGYLRLGGMIGDGAVLDEVYNTTDVSIIVKTDRIGEQYVSKYAPAGGEA